jgi:hypothetical protein
VSPLLQFKLQVYAASVAGQRAHPYPPNSPQELARKAWRDANEALISMPPSLLKELEEVDAAYRTE